jgi:hypothetical protein
LTGHPQILTIPRWGPADNCDRVAGVRSPGGRLGRTRRGKSPDGLGDEGKG